MGIRFILLILAVLGIWLILRIAFKPASGRLKNEPRAKLKAGNMVACKYCGLHIPETEAIKRGDHYYCCEEHAEADDESQ